MFDPTPLHEANVEAERFIAERTLELYHVFDIHMKDLCEACEYMHDREYERNRYAASENKASTDYGGA